MESSSDLQFSESFVRMSVFMYVWICFCVYVYVLVGGGTVYKNDNKFELRKYMCLLRSR